MQKTVNILNRKARFDYEIIGDYLARIVLTGIAIKSVRLGKLAIAERFYEFSNNEPFLINVTIKAYLYGTH